MKELKFKKVVFDSLGIELSRRCNLACKHCYKGESENKTMSKEVMQAFFNQVKKINRMFLGTGEPTLAVDQLKDLLDVVGIRYKC